MKEREVMEKWRSHFSFLLNEYQLEEKDQVEGPLEDTEEHESKQDPGPYGVKNEGCGSNWNKRAFSGL